MSMLLQHRNAAYIHVLVPYVIEARATVVLRYITEHDDQINSLPMPWGHCLSKGGLGADFCFPLYLEIPHNLISGVITFSPIIGSLRWKNIDTSTTLHRFFDNLLLTTTHRVPTGIP
jgi:hypothetical protein